MSRELNQRMVEEISRRLAELLAVPMSRVRVRLEPFVPGGDDAGVDRAAAAHGQLDLHGEPDL